MDEVHRQHIKRMLRLYNILINLLNQSSLLRYIVLCVCNFIDIIIHFIDNILTKLVATPDEPDIVCSNISLLLETPFPLILPCNKEKTVIYITTKPL